MSNSKNLYTEKEIGLEDAKNLGLLPEEYSKICKILGRNPTYTELGIYSALWSEHCSYKNSIRLLKTLPTKSKYALAQTGEENAGALDIGDGLAVVFKIESHNHPSAIEPYQGAATGVGGIMRDIFTMGARPLCSLNSLRFGPPQNNKRNAYLLNRVVKGIGDYGNSLGIPCVGGEVFFDESFTKNCLVNAMVVGVAKHSDLAFSRASGVDNPVYIVGATTGRDGVHGASFASQDLSKQSEDQRSAVQVGDPFLEKLLMEATLELLKSDAVVAIQDMGAAGLSCASSEMSSKGGVGMELFLDDVPKREKEMSAFEIMLSESQERMLVVVKKGREEEVEKVFEHYDLNVVKIGKITKNNLLNIYYQNHHCASIPVDTLVLGKGAPQYKRSMCRPLELSELQKLDIHKIKKEKHSHESSLKKEEVLERDFLQLLGSPNICSRREIYEQYDTDIGINTIIGPGSQGGVIRIPNTNKALAVSTDCNSRYVSLDPYLGSAIAVFESARNVASSGGRPIGITNCLNFANPYKPENYYMFTRSIRGMSAACKALKIPVTGGNVSFYNESENGPIMPTPTIGMVGVINDIEYHLNSHFKEAEKKIYLIGNFQPSLGGSEYLFQKYDLVRGLPPSLDMKSESDLIDFCIEASHSKILESACDLSLGGLALALFRSAYNPHLRNHVSFKINKNISELFQESNIDLEVFFFGETNNCILVSATHEKEILIQELAQTKSLPVVCIGETTLSSSHQGDFFDFYFFKAECHKSIDIYEKSLVF